MCLSLVLLALCLTVFLFSSTPVQQKRMAVRSEVSTEFIRLLCSLSCCRLYMYIVLARCLTPECVPLTARRLYLCLYSLHFVSLSVYRFPLLLTGGFGAHYRLND
jgi:hypothetical protein